MGHMLNQMSYWVLRFLCAELNNKIHCVYIISGIASVLAHLLAEVFSDDLLDLLHAALRSSAVEHLQRGRVLLRQQVVQSTEVLAHLDESTPVGTAQVSKTLRRPQMNLQVTEQRKHKQKTKLETVYKNCKERL